jgi:D-arabinose 1-dehydrogenase-like Zn-dependent alcohol dehydrogenase
MRAARYYGIEDIRVEEIEEPVCKEGQIKIRPAFVGICGTGEQVPMSRISQAQDILLLDY